MGAGRGDADGGAVRGVVRQSAQVRADRAPGGRADAGADRDRRPARPRGRTRRRHITAAAATPLVTQEALFGQAGIIATRSLGELVDVAALLACQPLPAGNRVAVVSNAGGAGVLAADACADNGLAVARLGAATRRRLRGLLPAGAAVAGPVDTTAAVTAEAFRACLEQVAADEGVDAVLAVTVPTAISDLTAAVAARPSPSRWPPRRSGGPSASSCCRPSPRRTATPELPLPRPAGDAPPRWRRCRPTPTPRMPPARSVTRPATRPGAGHQRSQVPELDGLHAEAARELNRRLPRPVTVRAAGCRPRRPASCWPALPVPMITTLPAASEEEALHAAVRLGGRVVLKAEARGVVHKTDAGAVRLDLRTPQDVSEAYRDLAARFGTALGRVLVQPMLSGGVEVMAGVVQEPVFGPLVVFGLGGVATDVLGDHTARLTPLTQADADDLISELHAAPLLLGHRGSPPADTAALADVLLRVSRLADDLPEVAELDLNPVVASPDGACAVDVRIRVVHAEHRDPFLRQLANRVLLGLSRRAIRRCGCPRPVPW